MRRVGGKTAISLVLAVALMTGVGLLVLTRLAVQDAFHSIVVKGRVSSFSSSSIVPLSNSDLTDGFYYYGDFGVLINGMNLNTLITFTSDLDRYMKDSQAGDYRVEYAAGFDASNTGDTLCLLGRATAEMLGVGPGDRIELLSTRIYYAQAAAYEDEEDIMAAVERQNVTYRIAGIIESDSGSADFRIFAQPGSAAQRIYGQSPFPIGYGELILTDNDRFDELDDLLSGQIRASRNYTSMASYYLDSTELENLRRILDLLVLLFPIAVAAAVLIGFTAPGLIIMQSAKEAAIMRVLGVTKRRARCMLVFEQVGLCVVGIALAAGGLALYNSGLLARSAETLALCGALYMSGCACAALWASVQVTRRRVLVLLQAKE